MIIILQYSLANDCRYVTPFPRGLERPSLMKHKAEEVIYYTYIYLIVITLIFLTAIIVPVSDTCDYHITPLSIHCITLPSTALYTVTMIWLEHSLSTNTLVDPSSHFLFKPLPIALPCPILNGCVIAIR